MTRRKEARLKQAEGKTGGKLLKKKKPTGITAGLKNKIINERINSLFFNQDCKFCIYDVMYFIIL